MSISFINTGKFDSQWESLGLGDEELMALQQELAADPFAGDVMKGTNGLRKVRFALPGAGKSGGARVAYAVFPGVGIVLLALVFAKNQKANLSDADKEYCKQQIERIKTIFGE